MIFEIYLFHIFNINLFNFKIKYNKIKSKFIYNIDTLIIFILFKYFLKKKYLNNIKSSKKNYLFYYKFVYEN
jgi:hypothetical protein